MKWALSFNGEETMIMLSIGDIVCVCSCVHCTCKSVHVCELHTCILPCTSYWDNTWFLSQ